MNNNMKVLQKKLNSISSYIILNMDFIKIGDYLIFDIYTHSMGQYIIIIEESTILTPILMAKLKKEDNLYISKADAYKQELNCYSLKYHVRYYQDDYIKIIDFLYIINDKIFADFLESEDDIINTENVTLLIKSIIYLIHDNNKYLKNIMPKFKTIDDLATHSLHVLIYAMNLGNALNLSTRKLLQLGTAALLHDIGTKKIDDAILNKEEKLSFSELETIQNHIQYSVDIMKFNDITDKFIINAVMQHHENNDGTGYPHKLHKEAISDYASILSIVDVFNALTSDRAHRKAFSSFNALKMMMQDKKMMNKFNTSYIELFLHSLK